MKISSKTLFHIDLEKKGEKSYSIEFKLSTVEYAKKLSKYQASRKLGVDPKRVREWCKQEERLRGEKNRNTQVSRKRLTGMY